MNKLQHQDLMNEWAARDNHHARVFVSDGPINWDIWEDQDTPKVLFLGKEAHGSDKSWDLSQWLDAHGPQYNIWWRLAYLTYGLHGLTKNNMLPDPLEHWSEVENKVVQAFRSMAVVNIKKSSGTSSSDTEDLRDYVRKDGNLIKRQVSSLQPHFIICGNTWSLVEYLWPSVKNISQRVYALHNRLILDYWHPASFYPNVMYYYTAMLLMQKGMRTVEKPYNEPVFKTVS